MKPSPVNNELSRGSLIKPERNPYGRPLKALSYRQNESTSGLFQKENSVSPPQRSVLPSTRMKAHHLLELHLVILLCALVGTVGNSDVLARSARSPKIKKGSQLTAKSFLRANATNALPQIVRTRTGPIRKMPLEGR